MSSRSFIVSVYYEFVKRPFYVVVQSHMREGHERLDVYQPDGLTELVISAVEHVTGGKKELLDRMCSLDAADKAASSHRLRRYIAQRQEDLYPNESSHLEDKSVEYKGYWIGTNADKKQAKAVVHLACRAAEVPYETVRKLVLTRVAPNPSIEGTASSGLRPPPAAPHVKR